MFFFQNKRLLNNSQKTNIVVLRDNDIAEIVYKINRINTPLTKCTIGEQGEYSVTIGNKKKRISQESVRVSI